MKKLNSIITLTLLSGILFFSSCEKDDDPVPEQMPEESTSIAAIASSNEDFSILVEALVKTDEEYVSEFDMDKAVQASCNYVDRIPNIH